MSATVETKIWMALKNGVEAVPGGYAIDWPLEQFTKPESNGSLDPYLEVRHLPAGVVWRPINSAGRQQQDGILQITLLLPAGDIGEKIHSDNAIQKAGQIASNFPTDFQMRFEDIAVRVTERPTVATPLRDGAYWRIPVSINYSCFA